MSFGEKLQLLRKEKGLSQEQLADMLFVSRQAVSKWELDSSLPDTVNVMQIADFFGVSIDYLLRDNIEKQNPAEDSEQQTFQAAEEKPFIKNKGLFAFRLGVFSCLCGIVGYAVLYIFSKIEPAPIFFQDANTGLWKVGFENFLLYHGLEPMCGLFTAAFFIGLLLIFHRTFFKMLKKLQSKLQ